MSEKREMSGAACAAFMGAVLLGLGGCAVALDRVVMPALDEIGNKMAGTYQQFEKNIRQHNMG